AITGLTLIALLLNGSSQYSAIPDNPDVAGARAKEKLLFESANRRYLAGDYSGARQLFLETAKVSQSAGLGHQAAVKWNNAGATAIHLGKYEIARSNLEQARQIAEAAHDPQALATALNTMADFAFRTGQYQQAARLAKEGLEGPARKANLRVVSMLRYH